MYRHHIVSPALVGSQLIALEKEATASSYLPVNAYALPLHGRIVTSAFGVRVVQQSNIRCKFFNDFYVKVCRDVNAERRFEGGKELNDGCELI